MAAVCADGEKPCRRHRRRPVERLAGAGGVDDVQLKVMFLEDTGLVAEVPGPRYPNCRAARRSSSAYRRAAAGWAKATAAITAAPARCRICFMAFPPLCADFLKPFDVVQAAEAATSALAPIDNHEQHDQHGVHARHVENAVGLDDQEADALVGKLVLGQPACQSAPRRGRAGRRLMIGWRIAGR